MTSKLDLEADNFLKKRRSTSSHPLEQLEEQPGALPVLKPPSVSTDTNNADVNVNINMNEMPRLLELVRRRAWIDAQKYTLELLTKSNSIYEPYNSALMNQRPLPENRENRNLRCDFIKILQLRFQAMIKLQRYDELQREITRLGLSQPPNNNNKTSTAALRPPFELVLDAIASMQYYNNAATTTGDNSIPTSQIQHANNFKCIDAIQELYLQLVDQQQGTIDNNWKEEGMMMTIQDITRLQCKCLMLQSNLFAKEGEFRMALSSLETILAEIKKYKQKSNIAGYRSWVDEVELYSRQGRLLLQAGALPSAAVVFERARDGSLAVPQEERNGKDYQRVQVQILMNEGLLYFAHFDYTLAEGRFGEALRLQRAFFSKDHGLKEKEKEEGGGVGTNIVDLEEDLTTPVLNNLALCSLYTCHMRQAVELIEELVREDPTRYMTECIVFNLCTLYELGSDTAISEKKKRILQLVAKRFSLHDIPDSAFRL